MINSQNYKKNRETDIVLELKPIGGGAKTAAGLVDSGLFTGDNKLHAIQNPQTCLWSLKYERGLLPGALKQQFTGWSSLLKFLEQYLAKRNIKITEIKD